MIHAVIDPYILLLPEDPFNSVDAEQFVDAIIEWSSAIQQRDYLVHSIPNNALEAIMNSGLYPYDDQLNTLARSLDHAVSATDLRAAARYLLQHSAPYTSIKDILVSANCQPALHLERLPNLISEAFATDIAIIALEQHRHQGMWVLATIEGPSIVAMLAVSCVVELLDENDVISDAKFEFAEALAVHSNCKTILENLDCLKAWMLKTQASASLAISAKITQLMLQGTQPGHKSFNFRIGDKFIESASAWGFYTDQSRARNLIEECAKVSLNIAKSKPFRTEKKQTSDQRIRICDQAKAYRNHITGSGPGFRLMFWQIGDNEIEFANVGDKDELVIY